MSASEIENQYEFEYNGVVTKADFYGADFVRELRRVVETYAPKRTNNFLEWGSGLSTLLLADLVAERGGHFITLDSDENYQAAICRAVRDQSLITAIAVDLIGARTDQSDPELNYATMPLSSGRIFDFILIDGRRRMECTYSSLLLVAPESIVVLHDYRRTRYQIVNFFYDTIEAGPQFLVMRAKPQILSAIEPSSAERLRPFQNLTPYPVQATDVDVAQLRRIIQGRDETITQLQEELRATRDEIRQAGELPDAHSQALHQHGNGITERDKAMQRLRNEIGEYERANALLEKQLAAVEEELHRLTSSFGWRMLQRYGRVKYRFLLPVYRLLKRRPYGPRT